MFISNAFAQTAASAPAAQQGGIESLMTGFFPFIVIMFVAMYFISIRPQIKQQKEHRAMMDALKKGDEVIAAGGIVGKIVRINDDYVTLEAAKDTEIIVKKSAISTLLPTGTIKTLEK